MYSTWDAKFNVSMFPCSFATRPAIDINTYIYPKQKTAVSSMGASPSVALSTESDVTTRHLSHIFCDSPSTAVSIRDAYLVQCKHSYISKLARLPESTHELLCQKREEYFLGKDDNSPHVTAMQLFELKDEQYMNNKGQLRKRPALSVLTDFGRDKFEEDTLFYVCGRGARVMLRNKSTTRCGTVIDLECDMVFTWTLA